MSDKKNTELLSLLDSGQVSEQEAFRLAVKYNSIIQIDILVEQGAQTNDMHLLSLATQYHHFDMLKHLIENKIVPLNATDPYDRKTGMLSPTSGGLAAIVAAEGNRADIIDYLLEQGVSLTATHPLAPLADHAISMQFASKDAAKLLFERDTKYHERHFFSRFSSQSDPLAFFRDQYKHNKMNGFMLAARANCFETFIEARLIRPLSSETPPFHLEDLTKEDGSGMSVIHYLNNHNQLGQIFDPRLWHGSPKAFHSLLHQFPKRYREKLDIEHIVHAFNLSQVSNTTNNPPAPKVRRRPTPPRP